MKKLTLNQAIELMKRIKENDINDEYDIVLKSTYNFNKKQIEPKFFIQSKLISITGGYNEHNRTSPKH